MNTTIPTESEVKSYFKYLQTHLVDKRDNRGKRHNLAFVLTGFLFAVLRSGTGLDVASIQRRMEKEHEGLSVLLGHSSKQSISDAQLRRVLAGVDYQSYNQLNQTYFGVSLSESAPAAKLPKEWQAIDGKELRGTIDGVSGEKRGENVVRMVSHERSQSEIMGFYQGDKESEKTVVKAYFSRQPALSEAYSFDALHTHPALLETIAGKEGTYLAQVKSNQAQLLAECEHVKLHLPGEYQLQSLDKAHGRVEKRVATFYQLKADWLDKRWKDTHIASLIVIDRERLRLKDQKQSQERAYFISNLPLEANSATILFSGVRNHWAVEADNYIRDVTLGEDQIRCKHTTRSRMIASVITIALNLMRKQDTKGNIKAFREDLNFCKQKAFACFSTT